MVFRWLLCLIILVAPVSSFARKYDHADTLRGSNGRCRAWWDVKRYHLHVRFDTLEHTISGSNQLGFYVTGSPSDSMQIDLQEPMELDSAFMIPDIHSSSIEKIAVAHESNVWWLKYHFSSLQVKDTASVVLYFHGKPRRAVNPPWDGGISWQHDSLGRQWIAVSCQGLGASVWWPCKDAQWDEPDNGMRIELEVPASLTAVSNGRMLSAGTDLTYTTSTWEVRNPINNYDVTFYIGNYAHWSDTLMGGNGTLDLDYYVLDYNEKRAKKQFEVVKPMLHCFEHWMGPYPFYEDGYKLVEAPYLGMEHQGAVAYGNNYKMGYKGMDRSGSGYGTMWDYIIIHESGHEWFGNSITAADMADNWIHEGITSYSEVLFTECLLGRDKALAYSRGLWKNIENEKPLIADYGVNREGPGDIYEKGAAVMHMIRAMMANDTKFNALLRGLSQNFYHSIVTTAQVEDYIISKTGLKLGPFFDQYLRTAHIPQLEYYVKDDKLHYRFDNVVAGFTLPLTATGSGRPVTIHPSADWQESPWKGGYNVKFSDDFLIKVKK